MNWASLRLTPWLDTRARFVAGVPRSGALLDLGSSDGETLGHFAELRPDLRLFAVDKAGEPEKYPEGCQFQQADLERNKLPWPDKSMDAVTCLHVVEHLNEVAPPIVEAARLLKPGGRIYLETPHLKTMDLATPAGAKAVGFTFNFADDPTHVRPVAIEALAGEATRSGLETVATGVSRNWIFASAWPFFLFMPPSRKKYTSQVHWIGWSAFLIARRPL